MHTADDLSDQFARERIAEINARAKCFHPVSAQWFTAHRVGCVICGESEPVKPACADVQDCPKCGDEGCY